MLIEPLLTGHTIPKIGFGTWNIGGGMSPDYSQDARGLAAIRAALETGYTHFDTAEMYANGHTEELLARAIRETRTPREKLFLTTKVWTNHLRTPETIKACENSLRRLQTDYLDLYLIHWPGSVPLEDTVRALNDLTRRGLVRAVGVSNFDLPLLHRAQAACETPLVNNQVPYSLHHREYAQNGVLAYCQQNGIVLTAYTPVEKGRVGTNPGLQTLARKHGATPTQIALAWLIHQPRVITIPMSHNPAHILENFRAREVKLDEDDIKQLNALK
ncbi:MAG: aldo/keto reductase [Anaerolineales bacterium]|nr:aldo/keto reductase [Anaerolineales bacterium]